MAKAYVFKVWRMSGGETIIEPTNNEAKIVFTVIPYDGRVSIMRHDGYSSNGDPLLVNKGIFHKFKGVSIIPENVLIASMGAGSFVRCESFLTPAEVNSSG